MNSPSISGGVLLILGNVVGAGVLALPIVTSNLGLGLTLFVLIGFWLLMLIGAFYLLEVNLAMPAGTNLVSMAKSLLGPWGAFVTWICYLLLMYSLIAAYISGGGDLISINLHYLGLTSSSSWSSLIFLVLFGSFVPLGIAKIDRFNRILMIMKLSVFFLVLMGLLPHLAPLKAVHYPLKQVSAPLLIVILTSYGFATIIPSLREYYQSDIKRIKSVMWFGMFLSLIFYLVWVFFIFFVVASQEEYSLEHMAVSSSPVADLQYAISHIVHRPWMTKAINLFSSICIITSFLINSISLTDFIKDGLFTNKKPAQTLLLYLLAYTPPLAAIVFYPRAFLLGLSIAGQLAIILLLILPGLMVWRTRHNAGHEHRHHQTLGSQLLLICVLFLSFGLLLSGNYIYVH